MTKTRKSVVLMLCCIALLTVLVVSGCGSSDSTGSTSESAAAGLTLTTLTPQSNGQVDGNVNWNLQYEPTSLDDAHSFNYAENTTIANMVDSLLRIEPDFSMKPCIASSWTNPNPTTYVYTIRSDVKFWDGTTLTPDDVAYSLNRNLDPDVGSYYGQYFQYVKSIKVTGPDQVTVKLKQPDASFNQAMACPAGGIIEKKYAESKGADYGSPSGGVMASGPFKLDHWTAGKEIVLTANPDYWDANLVPKIGQITFHFIGDGATLTSGLLSGQIDGAFQLPWDGLDKLSGSSVGKLYYGDSSIVFCLIVSAKTGPLADPQIRRALALAIDYEGIRKVAFAGAGLPTNALATSATWTYGGDTFKSAYAELPKLEQNLDEAKQLVQDAGSPQGKIVLAYAGGAAQYVSTIFNELQQAGQEIGLNVQIKAIPVKQYQTLYFDPEARKGIDGFETDWYPNLWDPMDFYANLTKGNSSNYGEYNNPEINSLYAQALATENGDQRAPIVAQLQAKCMDALAWMPMAQEPNLLFMNNRITGAPASFVQLEYPWAALLGAP
jgi:peptide/nickel transport system substrate-binding protein